MLKKFLKTLNNTLFSSKEKLKANQKTNQIEKFSIPKGYDIYIVAYDISENKIRNKVLKELKNFGIHTQYSVFEVVASPSKIKKLKKILQSYVKEANGSLVICKVKKNSYKYITFRYKEFVFILD